MLFTFPSRYWFTIGRVLVFSLRRWSSQIQTRLLVPRLTRVLIRREAKTVSRTQLLCSMAKLSRHSSATVWLCNSPGRLPSSPNKSHDSRKATPAGLTLCEFRLFRVRSPLLTESLICCLFLRVLRWFTSPGSLYAPMYSERSDQLKLAGFPHSEI